jgi:hypothetical protein
MFDLVGKPLFTALADAAEQHLGAGDACTLALRQAGTSGAASDIALAEAALKALPETMRDRFMAAAHRALREDPANLLGALGRAADRSRMH